MGCPVSRLAYQKDEEPATKPDEFDPGRARSSFVQRHLSSFISLSASSHGSMPKKLSLSMERQVERYSYPSPFPPRRRKSEIFRLEEYKDVDKYARKMPVCTLYGNFRAVMRYLTNNYLTDLEKVRSLFVWVTSINAKQIEHCLERLPARKTPLEAILRIHWKMGNYANFFVQLCRAAFIPCILVTGVSKAVGYQLGKKIDRSRMAHSWNAVFCDGEWRFIDIQLAMSQVPPKKEPEKKILACHRLMQEDNPDVNEAFFLMDPDQLLYFNLPDDPAWQLVHDPISDDQFIRRVYLQESYFRYGLRITRPLNHKNKCVFFTKNGELVLEYALPEDMAKRCYFRYSMSKYSKSKKPVFGLFKYVLYEKGTDSIKFHIRLPSKGRYKFYVYGKENAVPEDSDLCASYLIYNDTKVKKAPFPAYYEIGWGPHTDAASVGLSPLSHHHSAIEVTHGEVEICFKSEHSLNLSYILKHEALAESELWNNVMIEREPEELIISVRLQERGCYALSLHANNPDTPGMLPNVCNYLLRCDHSTHIVPFPKLHEGVLGQGINAHMFDINPKNSSAISTKLYSDTGELHLELACEHSMLIDMLCELHNCEIEPLILAERARVTAHGEDYHFDLDLPQRGEYALNIFARRSGYNKYRVYHVYTYLIIVTRKKKNHNPRPYFAQLETVPYFLTNEHADISLPCGRGPRTSELLFKHSQLQELDHQVIHSHANDKDVFQVFLPKEGEYQLDIFDENPNGTLCACVRYRIIRHTLPDETPPHMIRTSEGRLVSKDDCYRSKLRDAIDYDDIQALRDAIHNIEMNEVHGVETELARAKRQLGYLKINKELTEAMQTRNLTDLDHILMEAEMEELTEELGLKFKMAFKIRLQLVRLEKLKREIVMLDNKSISQIRDDHKPPPIVINVLKAMFVLLGVSDTQLKKWRSLQQQLNTTRKESLKKRIVQFNINKVPVEAAIKAKHYLQKVSLPDIRIVDENCALFYSWTKGMIDEAETRNKFSDRKIDEWGSTLDETWRKRKRKMTRVNHDPLIDSTIINL